MATRASDAPRGDWDYQFRDRPVTVPEFWVALEWTDGLRMTWTGSRDVEWTND